MAEVLPAGRFKETVWLNSNFNPIYRGERVKLFRTKPHLPEFDEVKQFRSIVCLTPKLKPAHYSSSVVVFPKDENVAKMEEVEVADRKDLLDDIIVKRQNEMAVVTSFSVINNRDEESEANNNNLDEKDFDILSKYTVDEQSLQFLNDQMNSMVDEDADEIHAIQANMAQTESVPDIENKGEQIDQHGEQLQLVDLVDAYARGEDLNNAKPQSRKGNDEQKISPEKIGQSEGKNGSRDFNGILPMKNDSSASKVQHTTHPRPNTKSSSLEKDLNQIEPVIKPISTTNTEKTRKDVHTESSLTDNRKQKPNPVQNGLNGIEPVIKPRTTYHTEKTSTESDVDAKSSLTGNRNQKPDKVIEKTAQVNQTPNSNVVSDKSRNIEENVHTKNKSKDSSSKNTKAETGEKENAVHILEGKGNSALKDFEQMEKFETRQSVKKPSKSIQGESVSSSKAESTEMKSQDEQSESNNTVAKSEIEHLERGTISNQNNDGSISKSTSVEQKSSAPSPSEATAPIKKPLRKSTKKKQFIAW